MLLQPITVPFSKSTLKPSVYTLISLTFNIVVLGVDFPEIARCHGIYHFLEIRLVAMVTTCLCLHMLIS